MSEKIGRHKGAVETLLHEKKELSRLLQIVNSQLERHLTALEEAGVDTDQFIEGIQQQSSDKRQNRKERRKNSSRERDQRSKQQSGKRSRASETKDSGSEDEREMEDFFEDEDDEDTGNRDFSPR